VDEEIIIINDRPARVTVDNGTRGTHLITMNDRVLINDTTFINHDKAQIRALGVAISPLLNITAHKDILILPCLHQLSERNLEFIKEFGREIDANHSHRIIFIATTICCTLICIGITCIRFIGARRSAIQLYGMIAELGPAEDGRNLEGGVVNIRQRTRTVGSVHET